MPRVLVIDDQKEVRAMLSIVLRIKHFEVTEAATAVEGLQIFDELSFDVAIVDVFLGDSNGLHVIAAMRERNPDIPIVAISGMATLNRTALPAELSNIACLQKPFRPNELFRAIDAARGAIRPVISAASG